VTEGQTVALLYPFATSLARICQSLATGWWFSPGNPVSSTNKINRHYKAEKLLKVALNTIKLNQQSFGGDFI
jgi:hypothetical protein